jgi:Holliday junction resolvasome RuvABC endonuclease subunit
MSGKLVRSPVVSSTRYLGIDLSSNHAAFVQLTDDKTKPLRWRFITDTASIAATAPTNSILMDLGKTKDPEQKALRRLAWWRENLDKVLDIFEPDYTAIEDYAFARAQGAHQLGEVGGLLRLALWDRKWRWRKYTPGQIKLFAAHTGKAEKDVMVAAVRDRWDQDWSCLRPGETKLWTSAEDAADAQSAAQLLEIEVRLRKGTCKLEMLHPQEIRIFNTVTKGLKTNLLDTEWIQNAGES